MTTSVNEFLELVLCGSSVATQVGVVAVVRQIIGDGQTLKSAVIQKPFSPDDEKGFVFIY